MIILYRGTPILIFPLYRNQLAFKISSCDKTQFVNSGCSILLQVTLEMEIANVKRFIHAAHTYKNWMRSHLAEIVEE